MSNWLFKKKTQKTEEMGLQEKKWILHGVSNDFIIDRP